MNDNEGLNLLIVDDDAGMRRSLRRIMKMRGYQVSLAESGREAIERVRQHEPHGILMDIRMPGLNGVETFLQIRDICPETFVVFMTAYSELADDARREGAVQVLSKPLDIDTACSLIEKTASTRPVLVIDDDPAFSKSLARSLAVKGWEIQTASGQDEALEIFHRNRRCIVLLDMKLNGSTGSSSRSDENHAGCLISCQLALLTLRKLAMLAILSLDRCLHSIEAAVS